MVYATYLLVPKGPKSDRRRLGRDCSVMWWLDATNRWTARISLAVKVLNMWAILRVSGYPWKITSVPASRSSACWASSWLDSRSMSVLNRNPSLDSFATYTLPRNLTGYGGGTGFAIEPKCLRCGVGV